MREITFVDGGVTYVQAATLNHAQNLGYFHGTRAIAAIEAV